MSDYESIPVVAAMDIALKYNRDIIVIATWSNEHELLHVTTYGITAKDKLLAAKGGEIVAAAMGFVGNDKSETYEDFRLNQDSAVQAAMKDVILKHLPALKKMACQIISPRDNVFSKMVNDFEKALAEPEF